MKMKQLAFCILLTFGVFSGGHSVHASKDIGSLFQSLSTGDPEVFYRIGQHYLDEGHSMPGVDAKEIGISYFRVAAAKGHVAAKQRIMELAAGQQLQPVFEPVSVSAGGSQFAQMGKVMKGTFKAALTMLQPDADTSFLDKLGFDQTDQFFAQFEQKVSYMMQTQHAADRRIDEQFSALKNFIVQQSQSQSVQHNFMTQTYQEAFERLERVEQRAHYSHPAEDLHELLRLSFQGDVLEIDAACTERIAPHYVGDNRALFLNYDASIKLVGGVNIEEQLRMLRLFPKCTSLDISHITFEDEARFRMFCRELANMKDLERLTLDYVTVSTSPLTEQQIREIMQSLKDLRGISLKGSPIRGDIFLTLPPNQIHELILEEGVAPENAEELLQQNHTSLTLDTQQNLMMQWANYNNKESLERFVIYNEALPKIKRHRYLADVYAKLAAKYEEQGDKAKGFSYYFKAAKLDHILAQRKVSQYFEAGVVVQERTIIQKDHQQAMQWAHAAAQQGDIPSLLNVADEYKYSTTGMQDVDRAIAAYEDIIKSDCDGRNKKRAYRELAEIYEKRECLEEAFKYHKLAAETGSVSSLKNAGYLLLRLWRQAKTKARSLVGYTDEELQADGTKFIAQLQQHQDSYPADISFLLGAYHTMGFGVQIDKLRAKQYFEAATTAGHTLAKLIADLAFVKEKKSLGSAFSKMLNRTFRAGKSDSDSGDSPHGRASDMAGTSAAVSHSVPPALSGKVFYAHNPSFVAGDSNPILCNLEEDYHKTRDVIEAYRAKISKVALRVDLERLFAPDALQDHGDPQVEVLPFKEIPAVLDKAYGALSQKSARDEANRKQFIEQIFTQVDKSDDSVFRARFQNVLSYYLKGAAGSLRLKKFINDLVDISVRSADGVIDHVSREDLSIRFYDQALDEKVKSLSLSKRVNLLLNRYKFDFLEKHCDRYGIPNGVTIAESTLLRERMRAPLGLDSQFVHPMYPCLGGAHMEMFGPEQVMQRFLEGGEIIFNQYMGSLPTDENEVMLKEHHVKFSPMSPETLIDLLKKTVENPADKTLTVEDLQQYVTNNPRLEKEFKKAFQNFEETEHFNPYSAKMIHVFKDAIYEDLLIEAGYLRR